MPATGMEGYFKIECGTDVSGEGLACHCPYCGHVGEHERFFTKEQIAYAESVGVRVLTGALYKHLKELDFDHKTRGTFGIGVSMKVQPGRPTPIHYYREKQLEAEVICFNCTLRYSVYGVFAFCPDCGQHNSLQIFDKNLELVGKMLKMSSATEGEVAERLVENALEDTVSAFDGFVREICRVHQKKATGPSKINRVSFQNLEILRERLAGLFVFDISSGLTAEEWSVAVRGFQKRHLLSHKMGVVDEDYVRKSGDPFAIVGRKVRVTVDEVGDFIHIVGKIARHVFERSERPKMV